MFEQVLQGQRHLSQRIDAQLDSLEQQLKETNLTVQENHATVLSRLNQQVPPIMQPPSQELLDSQSAEHRLSQPVSPAVNAATWVERQRLLKSLLAHKRSPLPPRDSGGGTSSRETPVAEEGESPDPIGARALRVSSRS